MELIVSDGIDISGPDDEEWMLLRKQFVENQGWMQVDGTDHDRYDRDPNTRQLVYRHCSKIMVGMRITPVETCLGSLSLEMMSDSYGGNPQGRGHPRGPANRGKIPRIAENPVLDGAAARESRDGGGGTLSEFVPKVPRMRAMTAPAH